MDDFLMKLRFRHVVGYILAYLLWLLAIVIGMIAVFEARNALNVVWPLLGTGTAWAWRLRAVDRFGLVFAGIVWLGYMIFAEDWFRMAITVVRRREHKGAPLPAVPSGPVGWTRRHLARLGLDVLASRFVWTMVPVVVIWLASIGIKALAFELLFR